MGNKYKNDGKRKRRKKAVPQQEAKLGGLDENMTVIRLWQVDPARLKEIGIGEKSP